MSLPTDIAAEIRVPLPSEEELRRIIGAYSGHERPSFRLMPDQDSG
jgi:hypothetical protein